MTMTAFRGAPLWRGLLALGFVAACGAGHAAEIGRVTFAAGTVTITNAAGATRAAKKSDALAVGDTVTTAPGGRAQLLFSDGGDVALQPDTVYRIEDYRYSGRPDGSELGVFRLVKGALRTVTGAIGRSNRDAYRVTTATATIGIRGTEYTARFSDVLRVSVAAGLVAMINRGGEIVVGPGQSGVAVSPDAAPVLTVDGAQLRAPAPAPVFQLVAGDLRNGEGYPLALSGDSHHAGSPGGVTGGTMFAVAMGDTANIGSSAGAFFPGATTADYNLVASGNDLSEFRYFNLAGVLGSAAVAESGSHSGISYGRWTTPGATASDFSNTFTNPVVAYVFADKNVLPLPTTGTVTLSPVGGTSPVNAAGVTGTFLGATLSLNFGAASNAVTLTGMMVSVNSATYTVNSLTSSGFFPGDDGRFSVFTTNTTCSGANCGASGFSAQASGLVINGGNTAGLAYTIKDPLGVNKSVVGAQVFQAGSPPI